MATLACPNCQMQIRTSYYKAHLKNQNCNVSIESLLEAKKQGEHQYKQQQLVIMKRKEAYDKTRQLKDKELKKELEKLKENYPLLGKVLADFLQMSKISPNVDQEGILLYTLDTMMEDKMNEILDLRNDDFEE